MPKPIKRTVKVASKKTMNDRKRKAKLLYNKAKTKKKKSSTALAVDIGFAILESPEASNFVGLLFKAFGSALCEHSKSIATESNDPLKLLNIKEKKND